MRTYYKMRAQVRKLTNKMQSKWQNAFINFYLYKKKGVLNNNILSPNIILSDGGLQVHDGSQAFFLFLPLQQL